MMQDDAGLVEVIARALDRNGVLDVPDDTVGLYPSWPKEAKKDLRRSARAALTAIEAAGYKVAPVEATANMEREAWKCDALHPRELWAVMLSASPKHG